MSTDETGEKKRGKRGRDPLNEYLGEEEADEHAVDAVTETLNEAGSVTALLDALSAVVADEGDEEGAVKIRAFRVEYARHELAVDREEEG